MRSGSAWANRRDASPPPRHARRPASEPPPRNRKAQGRREQSRVVQESRARSRSGIDRRLDDLVKYADKVRLDDDIRRLDDEIPLSPLPRIAPPHRPPPRWEESSYAGASQAAAEVAAKRAAAAQVKSQLQTTAAENASVKAKAAQGSAAAAEAEAHTTALAAVHGTRGRPPRAIRINEALDAEVRRGGDSEGIGPLREATFGWGGKGGEELISTRIGPEALQHHVACNDWVSAARVAVALAIQQSLDPVGQQIKPSIDNRQRRRGGARQDFNDGGYTAMGCQGSGYADGFIDRGYRDGGSDDSGHTEESHIGHRRRDLTAPQAPTAPERGVRSASKGGRTRHRPPTELPHVAAAWRPEEVRGGSESIVIKEKADTEGPGKRSAEETGEVGPYRDPVRGGPLHRDPHGDPYRDGEAGGWGPHRNLRQDCEGDVGREGEGVAEEGRPRAVLRCRWDDGAERAVDSGPLLALAKRDANVTRDTSVTLAAASELPTYTPLSFIGCTSRAIAAAPRGALPAAMAEEPGTSQYPCCSWCPCCITRHHAAPRTTAPRHPTRPQPTACHIM